MFLKSCILSVFLCLLWCLLPCRLQHIAMFYWRHTTGSAGCAFWGLLSPTPTLALFLSLSIAHLLRPLFSHATVICFHLAQRFYLAFRHAHGAAGINPRVVDPSLPLSSTSLLLRNVYYFLLYPVIIRNRQMGVTVSVYQWNRWKKATSHSERIHEFSSICM